MGTELQTIDRSAIRDAAVVGGTAISAAMGVPTAQELMCYQTWAKTAVDSNMYRGIGKEAGVMMIMLAAREFGIGPAQALNGGLNIIEGKVELSARIMSALIRRAKHTLKIKEDSTEKCTIYGRRADTGEEHEVTYSIEDAQRAGLVKEKGGWRKVPDDMLFARAMSKLARRLFSDVIGIGYVDGEICQPMTVSDEIQAVSELPSIELQPVNEEEMMQQLIKGLDKDEAHLMVEFVTLVSGHYKWTKIQTIQEFLKDPEETYNKFLKWKDKQSSKK